jgi:transcriptional regulator with XRE-family HTH domain
MAKRVSVVPDDDTSRIDVVQALIGARLARGLTQEQVAARLGLTPRSVSDFERSRFNPRLETLQRYARAVGCYVTVTVQDLPVGTDTLGATGNTGEGR